MRVASCSTFSGHDQWSRDITVCARRKLFNNKQLRCLYYSFNGWTVTRSVFTCMESTTTVFMTIGYIKNYTASDFSHIESKLDRVHLNLDLSDQKQGDTEMQNPERTVNNSALQDLKKAEQFYNATHTSQQKRRPWSSSFLDSELVSQAGGLFMSGVTLQSQVCEFCHAVFPGQTSTRGEFLRHLTTHMT
ncbi:hypothetical protein E1301_Tti018747 [Triplophysa tibetana]|uniref:Uncharacterized protein n=1 Tax=Triplophysa tibetana TaxID=1572043 RepID=A0A5A9NHZ8_9TELE|nr:hypothetical protein E1301_Tti018747 [Triplophysa tibetana]